MILAVRLLPSASNQLIRQLRSKISLLPLPLPQTNNMESSSPSKEFSDFLNFFPKVTLPVTIQYSDHHHFSKTNDALPDPLLISFIIPNLDFEMDEFTEFLPCLQFESVPGMHHVVIWSARLMHHSFYLMNFNSAGLFLDMSEIAGFYTDNDKVIQKMAHVDAEGTIYLVEGSMNETSHEINPGKTKKWQLIILTDGQFLSSEIKL